MGAKYTESQKQAAIKYLSEKTDNVQMRVPKGTKARWKAAAEERGLSLTQFIADLVEREIAE